MTRVSTRDLQSPPGRGYALQGVPGRWKVHRVKRARLRLQGDGIYAEWLCGNMSSKAFLSEDEGLLFAGGKEPCRGCEVTWEMRCGRRMGRKMAAGLLDL